MKKAIMRIGPSDAIMTKLLEYMNKIIAQKPSLCDSIERGELPESVVRQIEEYYRTLVRPDTPAEVVKNATQLFLNLLSIEG